MPGPINFRGVRLGLPICEDIWAPDVVECLQESGAEILLVPNGSPFESDKYHERQMHAVARVTETGLPLAYVNQVGGQDELVFDGGSFVLNSDCSLAAQAPSWREATVLTEWRRAGDGRWRCEPGDTAAPPEGLDELYSAMVLGLRD
jgi:NAD+ synthase